VLGLRREFVSYPLDIFRSIRVVLFCSIMPQTYYSTDSTTTPVDSLPPPLHHYTPCLAPRLTKIFGCSRFLKPSIHVRVGYACCLPVQLLPQEDGHHCLAFAWAARVPQLLLPSPSALSQAQYFASCVIHSQVPATLVSFALITRSRST
jgi:hypothetical protein